MVVQRDGYVWRCTVGYYPMEIGGVYRSHAKECRDRLDRIPGWWVFSRKGKESAGMWRTRKDAIVALLDEVNRDG